MRTSYVLFILAAVCAINFSGHALGAPPQSSPSEVLTRTDTPSGAPVPRFAALKYDKTNCRIGPSLKHEIRYRFQMARLPVIIIAETQDHWRKIRDFNGDRCWVHKTTLTAAKTAIVIREGAALRYKPNGASAVRARLGAGVVGKIDKSTDNWRRISAGGERGWIPASALWGAGVSPLGQDKP